MRRFTILIAFLMLQLTVLAQYTGVGTAVPKAQLHVESNNPDTVLIVRSNNTISTTPSMILEQKGYGVGLSIRIPNNSNFSRAISIDHKGSGPGLLAETSNGTAVWGIARNISAAGVIGDNLYGEAVIGRNKSGVGVGAVVGRNDSSGVGVRGFNSSEGIGVLGQSGMYGGHGISGRFENLNPSNTEDVLQLHSAGTGILLNATAMNTQSSLPVAYFSANGSRPQVCLVQVVESDYSRLRLTNWYSYNQYWDVAARVAYNNPSLSHLNFYVKAVSGSGSNVMRIEGSGNLWIAGTLTQNSDIRLKKNIQPLSNSLAGITRLNGYYYHWKSAERAQDLQTGVIAQELEKVFPELVKEDETGIKQVNYTGLIPHLIESVKEQQKQIEQLNAELQQLKKNIH